MINAMIAAFFLVFIRAIQQQNVIHGRYKSAAFTSYLMAFADVFIVLLVVDKGFPVIPWIGTGGALGVTLAMYTHKRWMR